MEASTAGGLLNRAELHLRGLSSSTELHFENKNQRVTGIDAGQHS
jgi:hypothetical protein